MGFNLGSAASSFVKGREQGLTSRLANSVEHQIASLDSRSGIVGKLARVAGDIGITDAVFSGITSAVTGADSFLGSKFNSLFGVQTSQSRSRNVNMDFVDPASGAAQTRVLTYPQNLGDFNTQLQFYRYSRPSPTVSPTLQPTTVIHLPLPQQFTDAHGVKYSTKDMGMMGSVVNGLNLASQQGAEARNFDGLAVAGAAGVASLVTSASSKLTTLVGLAGDNAADLTSQVTGSITNPNISVVFDGLQLRQYSLSWIFAPHNANESASIKKIIRQIRKLALPDKTFNDTTYLSYPSMVQPDLFPWAIGWDPNHPGNDADKRLIPFKKAMITDIKANYAADGPAVFFKDTHEPTFISLEIQFQEIEYFLATDFGGQGNVGLNISAADIEQRVTNIGTNVVNGFRQAVGLDALPTANTPAPATATNPQGG